MKLLLKAQYGQILEEKKHKARLFNLNFDPQLSGRLVHIFQVKSCWFTSMFDMCAYWGWPSQDKSISKCYINTFTAERQHGDWKHERQRVGHMYGGTWVSNWFFFSLHSSYLLCFGCHWITSDVWHLTLQTLSCFDISTLHLSAFKNSMLMFDLLRPGLWLLMRVTINRQIVQIKQSYPKRGKKGELLVAVLVPIKSLDTAVAGATVINIRKTMNS